MAAGVSTSGFSFLAGGGCSAAEVDGEPAGFKVGYERENYFYSWMGAVLPAYRRLGIAQKLADQQEKWAKSAGYTTIRFKTRNHHKGMFIFARATEN